MNVYLRMIVACALVSVGCSYEPTPGDVRSSRDVGAAESETGPGNTTGIGMGTGGIGSGPTGTGGTQPADNQAVEKNPD
ncbi:MAG TPA: hypothetical protein VHZ24_09315 [Pirellulales bacterium]|jgi:hypothetical protein|nr:hypothetical protein [Pirellulales bacterium]